MRIRTLFLYLIGNRRAILDIASNRGALWIGLLFVLSAGFAREYDGEDLLAEPWHLLVPVGASLATSLLLFLLTFRGGGEDRPGVSFSSAYRSFLTLYWMTAPLAWVYAIPFERFLDPYEATQANLACLGVVATWRVLLMIRVVSILMGYHPVAAVFRVLLFADIVALVAIQFLPVPILDIMGGIRLAPQERLLRNISCSICTWGIFTLPIWLIGTPITSRLRSRGWRVAAPSAERETGPSLGVVILAVASLMIWFFILPATQPEQRLRTRVERGFREGRVTEAMQTMSDYSPTDFPPHWDPPPRIAYGDRPGLLLQSLEWTMTWAPASWLHSVYVNKLRFQLSRWLVSGYSLSEEDWRQVAKLLKQAPEGAELAREAVAVLKKEYGEARRDSEDSERKGRDEVLELAGVKLPAKEKAKHPDDLPK